MRRVKRSGLPRVAIGPGEIAGYFSRLTSGFRSLGVRCEHFVLSSHPFAYSEHHYFLKGFNDLATRISTRWGRVGKLIGTVRHLLRVPAFVFALLKYDTFVFSGFGSFFKFHELPILKALGKRVIIVLVGSDARPPLFSGRHLDDGQHASMALLKAETAAMKRRLRKIEEYADWIICHTATDQFLQKPYVRWAAVGLPVTIEEGPVTARGGERIRILHAPSRPIAKGSGVFREIIEDLRGEGFDIEYVELVGVSNAQVLRELESCDFVVDELYSDAPMAMFAAEAAAFGKPAVVGSYYAAEYSRHNPDEVHPPTLFVAPEDVRAAVRRLVEDKAYRLDLGRRAKEFVLAEWKDSVVARKYLDILQGTAPGDWTCDPCLTSYVWGWGLPRDEWRRRVREYLEEFGVPSLFLDGKPELVTKITREVDFPGLHHA
jgi:hypothetical protein